MPPRSKLSALEELFIQVGLAAPDHLISTKDLEKEAKGATNQETTNALNALLRKNLATLQRSSNGDTYFRFVTKDEAKAMSTLDNEEKLVFDQIKDSGNQGIWSKTLIARTGLARTTITKVLKSLEGRKFVKSVKSVKTPTRKMYMLAGVTPSVELTGGAWFNENDLDKEFVSYIMKGVLKCLREKTVAPEKSRLYAPSALRHLPGVPEITAYIRSKKLSNIDLREADIEALLDVMVYDGGVERVFAGASARPVAPAAAEPRKRRRLSPDSTDDESDDFDSDEDAAAARARGRGRASKRRRKARTAVKDEDSDALDAEEVAEEEDSDAENVEIDPAENDKGYVYRIVNEYLPLTGLTDVPCGPAEMGGAVGGLPGGPSDMLAPTQKRRLLAALRAGERPASPVEYTSPASGMKGVGMLGGAGAAIGTLSSFSNEFGMYSVNTPPPGEDKGLYFRDWLDV